MTPKIGKKVCNEVHALIMPNVFIFIVRKCAKYSFYINEGEVGVLIRNALLNSWNLYETSVILSRGIT